jgi:catechol 2,3-dioxygenase
MTGQDKVRPKSEFRIHPATRPGRVALTVAKLDEQLEFYRQVIGLQLHWREGTRAGLGVGGRDLLRLTEVAQARRYHGTTGIYHFAILLPNRRELARAMARLFSLNYQNYPTDHIMTQTTYLDDPEGNNIELYADTPEEGSFGLVNGQLVAQRANGAASNGREPLDIEKLFAELTPEDRLEQPMPPETTLGHVHLYVANLETTMRFYHDLLGFDSMGIAGSFRMGMVSVAGYHHHIGFNTWVGEGAPPPPPDALGLRYFTLVLPNATELEKVVERIKVDGIDSEQLQEGILLRDPSQNGLLLTENREAI